MTFFNYLGKNFSYKKKEENTNFKFEKTYELKGANRLKLVEIISIISAIYLIVFFIYNMRDLSNIGMIVQPEFQRVYGSGFNFFLRLFCLIGTAYFLGLANKNNKRFFLWAALCFVPNFATFVQGIGFIAILGGAIAYIYINKKRVTINSSLLIIFAGLSIFFIVNMIEIGIWNLHLLTDRETYGLILSRLNVYLMSGVQSFNININYNVNIFQDLPNIVFAFLYNFLARFELFERVETINSVWITLGYMPSFGMVRVNTNTHIGTLVLYSGFFEGILVNAVISMVIYYFFWKANRRSNILDIIRYSIFVSGLMLAWFEYFYMHTFWFYLLAIIMLFKAIYSVRSKWALRARHPTHLNLPMEI